MQEGLHESLVTRELESAITRETHLEAELARVDEADQTHVLTRHLAGAIRQRLGAIRTSQRVGGR